MSLRSTTFGAEAPPLASLSGFEDDGADGGGTPLLPALVSDLSLAGTCGAAGVDGPPPGGGGGGGAPPPRRAEDVVLTRLTEKSTSEPPECD